MLDTVPMSFCFLDHRSPTELRLKVRLRNGAGGYQVGLGWVERVDFGVDTCNAHHVEAPLMGLAQGTVPDLGSWIIDYPFDLSRVRLIPAT
jgi:hypothetical protein